jgi:hypothetical protein
MKYLKLFESERSFREIDLQQLYDDLIKYGGRLFSKPVHLDVYFDKRVLNPLFVDKDIEFRRIVNPIDQEVSYSYKGKVSKIDMYDESNLKTITVNLYKNENFRNFSEDLKYILAKIYFSERLKKPQIIKIYDCGIIPFEENLEQLKMEDDAERYNL